VVRASRNTDDSIVVAGMSASEAIARVRALAEARSCVVAEPSHGVVHIAHTSKSVLARKTHLCTVRASNAPSGLTLHIAGDIDVELLGEIRSEMDNPSRVSLPSVISFAPPMVPPGSGGAFVPPSDWFVGTAPPDASVDATLHRASGAMTNPPSAPKVPIVRVSDGRSIPLAEVMLFGRDPSTRDGVQATLVPVDDPTISKTHLAIGREHGCVWIEDRHSTNGTQMLDALGRQVIVPPGVRTVVVLPVTLLLGDTTLTVAGAS
jgi:hypothetical protein